MRALAWAGLFVIALACGGSPAPRPSPIPVPLANLTYIPQVHRLSCETAALQMALAHLHIDRGQDAILAAIGVDRTPPEFDAAHNLAHWGDPYAHFVGDPDGREVDLTGYGVYYPPLVDAARRFGGRVLAAGETVAPETVYQAVAAGHPVVAWVAMSGDGDYSPQPTTTYTAFDGRQVLFGQGFEHTVLVTAARPDAVYVLDPEPDVGAHWLPRPVFEASFRTFDQMAIVIA